MASNAATAPHIGDIFHLIHRLFGLTQRPLRPVSRMTSDPVSRQQTKTCKAAGFEKKPHNSERAHRLCSRMWSEQQVQQQLPAFPPGVPHLFYISLSSLYLFICLSLCLSIYLSIHPSIYLLSVCLSVYLPACLSVYCLSIIYLSSMFFSMLICSILFCLSIYIYLCMSTYLSTIYLSILLFYSVCLSVCLSVGPSIHPSTICLSVYYYLSLCLFVFFLSLSRSL